MDIYISRDGSQEGPFEIMAINSMIADKSLKTYDYAWYEGLAGWIMVKDVPGLLLPQTTPPPLVKIIPPHKKTGPAVTKEATQQTAPSKKPKVIYSKSENCFEGLLSDIVKLAMRAVVESKYTVENVNDSVGMITFKTGMTLTSFQGASCSITFIEIEEGKYTAQSAGKQNVSGAQLMALDFGGAKRIAEKVIDHMKKIASA